MPAFDWNSSGKVGATWNAHRLVLKAAQLDEQQGDLAKDDPTACVETLQVRLMDRFYEDYHANGKDMSDNAYLAGVAREFKLFGSEADAVEWLKSDDLEYELGNKLQQAEMNGVRSIPFYIVNVSIGSRHNRNGFAMFHTLRGTDSKVCLHSLISTRTVRII